MNPLFIEESSAKITTSDREAEVLPVFGILQTSFIIDLIFLLQLPPSINPPTA